MARFRYTAADADGKSVSGFVESDSIEQARKQLESQGLSAVEIEPEDETATAAPRSVQAEATSQAGQLMAAGMPLSAGLRALAEETDSRPLARVLSKMADRLDAGDDINEVFSGESLQVPAYLKGLIHAGTQMGDLAGGIEHYVQFGRLRAKIRSRVRVSLAYPLALLSISLLVMFGALFLILPQFKSIFDGFGVELPWLTSTMLNLSTLTVRAVEWWPITLACGVLLPVLAAFVKNLFGPPAWRRFLYIVPLFGPTLRYGALAEYCHLLAILIDHGLPLPDALHLAGEGVSDWNLREGSYILSKQVEAGSLPGQGDAVSQFPRDILNVMSWDMSGAGDGQSDQSPGDVLRGAGEIYSAHAEVHSRTITAAMEPAAIFLVTCLVSLLVVAMFMPMVKLLNDLS